MNVYLDSSVILRHLLNQKNRLKSWGDWNSAYVSTLVRTEVLRTFHRLRLEGVVTDDDLVDLRTSFDLIWQSLYRVPLNEKILEEASEPIPTVIGTLDALHLITAVKIKRQIQDRDFRLLTFDGQLKKAALATGLRCNE